MQSIPLNWWAIIVAAAVKFVIGMAWYSPAMFARQWMALLGLTEADFRARMVPALIAEVVCDLLAAFILYHAVVYAGASTILQGAAVGFLNWLGFVFTFSIGQVYYEGRPWRLWAINNGYWLLSLIVMGAIFAIWH